MLLGIATVTWALGQIVQAAVSYQMNWRRRMEGRINHMDKHIIVCGLGRVGAALCRHLAESKTPFVIVERDEHRAAWAVEQGYAVIDGCGTDDSALIRAGLHRAKGMVACTSSDAQNIMITLSARALHESITIVGRAVQEDAIHKLERAGASRVMAPAHTAGKDIATYLSNPALADFLDQTTNAGIGFRMSECLVGVGSPLIGRTLGEVGAEHPGTVFVAIKHPSGVTRIRPEADEVIEEHDILAVVAHEAELAAFFELAQGDEACEHLAA